MTNSRLLTHIVDWEWTNTIRGKLGHLPDGFSVEVDTSERLWLCYNGADWEKITNRLDGVVADRLNQRACLGDLNMDASDWQIKDDVLRLIEEAQACLRGQEATLVS